MAALEYLGMMAIVVMVFSRAFSVGRTYPAYELSRPHGLELLRAGDAPEQRPDVLLMDEVLAVGDQAFQTKCLERFVETTCQRALWLERGEVCWIRSAAEVVAAYVGSG